MHSSGPYYRTCRAILFIRVLLPVWFADLLTLKTKEHIGIFWVLWQKVPLHALTKSLALYHPQKGPTSNSSSLSSTTCHCVICGWNYCVPFSG
jgi:hypothetical protein